MASNDETLHDVLDALRNHLAADPAPPLHTMDTPMNLEAKRSWPVVDTRILPQPVAAEVFADDIPVLDDMVVAGDPTVRQRLGAQQRTPGRIDRGLRLVAPAAQTAEHPTDIDQASAVTADDETGTPAPGLEDSIDLTLNPDLADEFVDAIENGIHQHLSRVLQERMTGAVEAVATELRDELRTMVRGYVDTYLPEFLADGSNEDTNTPELPNNTP